MIFKKINVLIKVNHYDSFSGVSGSPSFTPGSTIIKTQNAITAV